MGTTNRTQQAETQASSPSPAPASRPWRRPGDLGRAVLACLASGQHGYCEIGRAIGRRPSEVRKVMATLVRAGAAPAQAAIEDRGRLSRTILAFLAVPRRICEVVRHTGAPRGTVRGQLDALVCAGQAARVGRGLTVATGQPRVMPTGRWRRRQCRAAGGGSWSATRSWPSWASPAKRGRWRRISAGRCRTPRATSRRCGGGAWWCAPAMAATSGRSRCQTRRGRRLPLAWPPKPGRDPRMRTPRPPCRAPAAAASCRGTGRRAAPVLSIIDKKGRVVGRLSPADEAIILAAFAASCATAQARTRGADVVRTAQQRECRFRCDCLGPADPAPVLVPITETHIRRCPYHPEHAADCPFEMTAAEREGYVASLREPAAGESFKLARAIRQASGPPLWLRGSHKCGTTFSQI